MILLNYDKLAWFEVTEEGKIRFAEKKFNSVTETMDPVRVKFGTDRLVMVNPDGEVSPLKSSLRKFKASDLLGEARQKLGERNLVYSGL
jgi:hypothetical protein